MASAGVGLQGNPFGTGSNQWGSGWPAMNFQQPNFYGDPSPSSGGYGGFYPNKSGTPTSVPGNWPAGGGFYAGSAYDPALTSDMFGYLQSQVGQGSQMFPGQLTAGPNSVLQQIQALLTGGQSSLPGASQIASMAQTGNPIDQTAAWRAMVASQQQNIQEQQANLKEQYAAGGNLVGTPYGSAMSDYMSQTALGQNAMLAQMQTAALENAAQREAAMQSQLLGTGLSTSGQLQGINQLGLSNAYNEWLRTQPQYNPLLSYQYGASTTFPPYMTQQPQVSPFAYLIPALSQWASSSNAPKWPSFQGPSPSGPFPGGGNIPGDTGMPPGWGSSWDPATWSQGGPESGYQGSSSSYDASGNPILIDRSGNPISPEPLPGIGVDTGSGPGVDTGGGSDLSGYFGGDFGYGGSDYGMIY